MIKICALQLPTQPMSESRLDYYFRLCAEEQSRLVVLGEYVLNSFFKELETMPKSLIKEQSERKKDALSQMAKRYGIEILAPLILPKGKGFAKVMARFSPNQSKFLQQQILMPYPHWNEAAYFTNENSGELSFMVFTHERFKIGVMFGYEAHFDAAWRYMLRKKVDVVVVVTACTFFSETRWEELLKTRAFTNGVYVLRVNRVGNYLSQDEQWKFYGDSMLINPFGEIVSSLGENEEMLVAELDKKEINEARQNWGFMQIINKRGL